MSRYFTEKYIQMAYKDMKRCSVYLAVRENKLKPRGDITIQLSEG